MFNLVKTKLQTNTFSKTHYLYNKHFSDSYKSEFEDPCKCPEPKKEPDKVIQEHDCTPCSFHSWKPKLKTCYPIKEEEKQKMPRMCYAGMGDKNKLTNCQIKDIATAKWKQMDPHNKNPCEKKILPKLKQGPFHCAEDILPKSDWEC